VECNCLNILSQYNYKKTRTCAAIFDGSNHDMRRVSKIVLDDDNDDDDVKANKGKISYRNGVDVTLVARERLFAHAIANVP
jgi:hypothetical protein